MKLTKQDGYIILFWLLVAVIVGLNEIGLGVISLLLFLPAGLLMSKTFGKEKEE